MDALDEKVGFEETERADKLREIAEIGESLIQKTDELKKCNTKTYNKYPRINLVITPEREAMLKECCEIVGSDKSLVDDRRADAIWDIIEWVLPMLRVKRGLTEQLIGLGFKQVELK